MKTLLIPEHLPDYFLMEGTEEELSFPMKAQVSPAPADMDPGDPMDLQFREAHPMPAIPRWGINE